MDIMDQDTTVMVPDIQKGYMFMVDITEDFIISGEVTMEDSTDRIKIKKALKIQCFSFIL